MLVSVMSTAAQAVAAGSAAPASDDAAILHKGDADLASAGAREAVADTAAQTDPEPAATCDEDYSDPDHPYIATDFEGLKNLIGADNSYHPKTVYIKLGQDISHTNRAPQNGPTPRDYMQTNRTTVFLDLAGYTLSFDTDNDKNPCLLYGELGVITIRDSGRYDSVKKQWVTGRIEYKNSAKTTTSVLRGIIVLESGTIVNKTHFSDSSSQSYGYIGFGAYSHLKLRGGVLEADTPIFLNSNRRGGTSSDLRNAEISGGTLRITGDTGVKLKFTHAELNKITHFTESYADTEFPKIINCVMENASSNAKVNAFDVDFPDEDEETGGYLNPVMLDNATAPTVMDYIIPDSTYAYFDGKLRSNFSDISLIEAEDRVTGPGFSSVCELCHTELIENIDLIIPQATLGTLVAYSAYTPSGSNYSVMNYTDGKTWKNGVLWAKGGIAANINYQNFYDTEVYTVCINVGLTYTRGHVFSGYRGSSPVEATVNGHEAKVIIISPESVIVQYTIDLTEGSRFDSLSVTVPEPKVGGLISYDAEVPGNAGYLVEDKTSGAWISGVKWVDDNGDDVAPGSTFRNGHYYTAVISLYAENPDMMRFDYADNLHATVNGVKATVRRYSDSYVQVIRTFCVADPLIDILDVTVTRPMHGAAIVYSAAVPEEAGYEVEFFSDGSIWENGVWWKHNGKYLDPQQDHYFEYGET